MGAGHTVGRAGAGRPGRWEVSSAAGATRRSAAGWAAVVAALVLGATACGTAATADTTSSTAGSTVATSAVQATEQGISDLRDVRYCEVIPLTPEGGRVVAEIYNTLTLNDCPPERWATITAEGAAAEYGVAAARLNGPRHWVLDGIVGSGLSTSGKRFTFGGSGGLEMERRAVVELGPAQVAAGVTPYTPNLVQRDTIWQFDAGKPVFELTGPDGAVYVMQSYSRIVDPGLTYDQLAGLGSRLVLPPGWSYGTRTLAEPLALTTERTGGVATVIQDELQNSYQLVVR